VTVFRSARHWSLFWTRCIQFTRPHTLFRYPLDRRLGGTQSRSGLDAVVKRKFLSLRRDSTPDHPRGAQLKHRDNFTLFTLCTDRDEVTHTAPECVSFGTRIKGEALTYFLPFGMRL